jgi:hypothetical protein
MLALILSVSGQRLVEGVLTDDLSERGLRDLIDRGTDAFNVDHRFTASTTRK